MIITNNLETSKHKELVNMYKVNVPKIKKRYVSSDTFLYGYWYRRLVSVSKQQTLTKCRLGVGVLNIVSRLKIERFVVREPID